MGSQTNFLLIFGLFGHLWPSVYAFTLTHTAFPDATQKERIYPGGKMPIPIPQPDNSVSDVDVQSRNDNRPYNRVEAPNVHVEAPDVDINFSPNFLGD